MAIFYLKFGDTLPVLEVSLKNPDGSAYDLTGSTAWNLNIMLSDGTAITRSMTKAGADEDGKLQYAWQSTDWESGGLVASPRIPLKPGIKEHRMEYQVTTGTAVITFPNHDYDTLRIAEALDQGT